MNHIHPSAVIGPDVDFGVDNIVGPYAVICGPTRIGDGNFIGPHVAIGTPGEIRNGPHTAVWDGGTVGAGTVIGSRNVIREFVTVQTTGPTPTVIGDDCYIMTKAHIPHDAYIGDRSTIACGVLIGGHGQIGADANIGLGAAIHQFLVIGPGAMVGMGAVVTRSVPPFAVAYGSPARVRGANRVGMERIGLEHRDIDELDETYAEWDGNHLIAPAQVSDRFEWFRDACTRVQRSGH